MPSDRAGRLEKQVGGYSAFVPAPLPPRDLDIGPHLQALLSDADLALGRLDGAIDVVPRPDQFVLMYVRREAVLSSQIEGTDASLMDVLEYEAVKERGEARMDVREIVNHVDALHHGLSRLADLPLSRRLMCEVHEILMRGVRGGEPHKIPGQFRRSQNWIGGASPATARFVPPPPEHVGEAFAALEEFLHASDPMPPLVKAGLVHAQFETIHPFLDGNGRTGRLLITFWLAERGVLKKPLLYPSLFFKEHREEYIDRLQAIRDDGAWEDWLAFFLDGIAHVAAEATERALEIVALRERDRGRIIAQLGRRAHTGLTLLELLLAHPVVTSSSVMRMVEVSSPTANALVRDFERIGILKETTGRRRRRIFSYREYLDLFPDAATRR